MADRTDARLAMLRAKIERLREKVSEAEAERDEVIRTARAEGKPLRSIAERAGVSHTWVAKIERDG